MTTPEEVKEIIEELCRRYNVQCVEDYLTILEYDVLEDVIKYNPSEIARMYEVEGKPLGIDLEKYLNTDLMHEINHRRQFMEMRRKCPNIFEKFLRVIGGLKSAVLDPAADEALPPEKREIARRLLEELVKLKRRAIEVDPVKIAFELEEELVTALVNRDPGPLQRYFFTIAYLTEEDLEKLGLKNSIHEEILKELKKIQELAKVDVCKAAEKVLELCERFNLPCVV